MLSPGLAPSHGVARARPDTAAWLARCGRLTAICGLLLGFWPAVARAQADRPRFDALVARGDSAWTAGRFPAAKAAYREALAIDSTGSSRATYRLAVIHSWDGDLPRALALFRHYTVLEPRDEEGRIALARAYAWNGETDRAVALSDSILARDSTYRDAALAAAQAAAWGGRFRDAVGRYDRWLRFNPKDVEAELARARTLAWWGRLAEAERAYLAIAARGERLEAEKGVALVAGWRGDLGRSERLWRAIATRLPKDAEGWVGLAQVLRWSGRPDDAKAALDRALAADPANADAAAQLRWVRADLAKAAEPFVTASWDSDDNRSFSFGDGISFRPFKGGRLTVGGLHRRAELGQATGRSHAGRVSLRVAAGRSATLTFEGGVTRTSADGPAGATSRTAPTAAAVATVRLTSGLSFGGGVRRSVFDETASLMAAEIDVTSASAEFELALPGRWTLVGGGERAKLRGGSGPNERQAGFGSLRLRARRSLSLAASARGFGYDEQRRDGYFSPARYRLGEGSIRWSPGRDLGWAGLFEVGLGGQEVRFGAEPAVARGTQRAAVGLGYRPGPGSEIMLDYAFSNVSATASGPAGGSIYRAHALSLRARLIW
ncbi:MAG: tetratricopeptide repeat protein [Gemmatimonadales bacterium]|nr:tetratricopeptide repeat protein [Gemmatimonadales bacterium]